MDSKGVRFLPVVADVPSPGAPPPGGATRQQPGDGSHEAKPAVDELQRGGGGGAGGGAVATVQAPSQTVVGVLSRDSVRIARRLTETERAIRDVSSP